MTNDIPPERMCEGCWYTHENNIWPCFAGNQIGTTIALKDAALIVAEHNYLVWYKLNMLKGYSAKMEESTQMILSGEFWRRRWEELSK